MSKLTKGQHVEYALPYSPSWKVECRVRRVHRDGTVTVEARFCRKPDGTRTGGFLGYKYRLEATILRVMP